LVRQRDELQRRPRPVVDDVGIAPTVLHIPGGAPPERERVPAPAPDVAAARRIESDVRRRAAAVAMQARRQFIAGDHQGALATLHEFSPQELVAPVIAELETELRRFKRRREETARGIAAVTTPVPAPPVQPVVETRPPRPERPPAERSSTGRSSAIAPAPKASTSQSSPPVTAKAVPPAPVFTPGFVPTWQHGVIALIVLLLFIAVFTYAC
jgi:hypothetical protein